MHGVLKSPDLSRVWFSGYGVCRKCRKYHPEFRLTPDLLGVAAFDWEHKHRLCELEKPGSVEFVFNHKDIPRGFDDRVYENAGVAPVWLDAAWKPNANVMMVYIADGAITMDLSALASSSNFTAGREATYINNSSRYMAAKITGTYISGTTPTAPGESRLYMITPTEDTPTWPDVFDGTDSAETVTNTNILDSFPCIWSGTVSTTSNITYPIESLEIGQAFGYVPQYFTLFFSHYHTAALKTDANNTNKLYKQFAQAEIS